jgi:hypothetical protein
MKLSNRGHYACYSLAAPFDPKIRMPGRVDLPLLPGAQCEAQGGGESPLAVIKILFESS